MLSKEDGRRLAQLERQLRRDDPAFCTRMAGGVSQEADRHAPFALIITAVVIWIAALILAILGWWIAAAVATLTATAVAAILTYRLTHPRPTG